MPARGVDRSAAAPHRPPAAGGARRSGPAARGSRLGALLALSALGCGSVDPGPDFQFAELIFEQGYFYCSVEPMLVEQRCGPGDPAKDPAGGCHSAVTTFRLLPHDPVPCDGQAPRAASVPAEAQGNYQAASRLMAPDP